MKKSTRAGFGDGLLDIGNDERVILLDLDLTKATCSDGFAKAYPKRTIQCGIAEANAIGLASGLSEHGFKVFVPSFGSFLTGRYDTIRCSVAMSKAPVILVGTHSGLSPSLDGPTQSSREDIALMRALPNMVVLQPATYNEARAMTSYLGSVDLINPVYMRIGRQAVKEEIFEDFDMGINLVVKGTSDYVFFSSGCLLSETLEVAKEKKATVYNVNCLKPFDTDKFFKVVKKESKIYTIEDHSIYGGLGSIISEVACELGGYNVKKIGIKDTFAECGIPEDVYAKYGLDTKGIYEQIH